MMFYIMYSMSMNQGLDKMSGGRDLKTILNFGNYVIGLFAIIFLFYTNSFLIKQRKKEFGLFNILGMEKKHLSRIIMYETLYVAIISFIAGICGGILLNKLMFLLLLKILNFQVPMGFFVSVKGIIVTLILFSMIFLLTLLNTMRQIHLTKPIELLKGGQTGEKEPKTKWILVILGLLSLGGGYYIAVTTKDPLDALMYFFFAVILVIIGTYCLFTVVSIAFLKALRKNKNYYYKTKHFVSVSGMIYRMKQNAVGLANICILSTMVLVIISTTVSLYIGMEDVLRNRFPRNIMISSRDCSSEYRDETRKTIDKILEKHNLTSENVLDIDMGAIFARRDGSTFKMEQIDGDLTGFKGLYFVTVSDYNQNLNKDVTLKDNEILIYSPEGDYEEEKLNILDRTFTVKENLETFIDGFNKADIVDNYYIIVRDRGVIEEITGNVDKTEEALNNYIINYIGFDLDGKDADAVAVYNDISSELSETDSRIESAAVSKESLYSLYGGLFFLGIFLGSLFMMATILIIYYKQISEGYEDRERFAIMQKVGMSQEEIKKTIHGQVLTVFFLPLVTAVIHIVFAFPVITKLLAIFNLTNKALFAACTGGTILIFACFYGIIYWITAREYYKIVK